MAIPAAYAKAIGKTRKDIDNLIASRKKELQVVDQCFHDHEQTRRELQIARGDLDSAHQQTQEATIARDTARSDCVELNRVLTRVKDDLRQANVRV